GRDRDLAHDTTHYVSEMRDFMRRIATPATRVRAAASVDTRMGRLFAGGEASLGSGIDLDSSTDLAYSFGWMHPATPWSPRLSWSGRADGGRVLAGAIRVPFGPFGIDVEARHTGGLDAGSAFGFSLLLTR